MKIRLIKLRRKTSSIKARRALENNGSHSRNPLAGGSGPGGLDRTSQSTDTGVSGIIYRQEAKAQERRG